VEDTETTEITWLVTKGRDRIVTSRLSFYFLFLVVFLTVFLVAVFLTVFFLVSFFISFLSME